MPEQKNLILIPDQMVDWGFPQVLKKGAEDIILCGHPGKNEYYTFRFKFPKNYQVKPFLLTANCFLTVISGEIYLGEGDKYNQDSMQILPVGSFGVIVKNKPIYFMNHEESVIQFHGQGPIDLTYIDQADDPRLSR